MSEDKKFLTTKELSERWGGSPTPATLRQWRHQKRGVRYVKMGNMARYPLSEVIKYEKKLEKSAKL